MAAGEKELGPPEGFDFTEHMRRLCSDICERSPHMQHIDMTRVFVSFNQARKRVKHGMWASLTPMRFENGSRETVRKGRRYAAQRLLDRDGHEMLYILSFYLPRFMELSFTDKMVTVFHELWHISPECNGDIRRHPGRCYAHTQSEKEYDAQMLVFFEDWLRRSPPKPLYAWLRQTFLDLESQHGGVYGTRIGHPKLIPLDGKAR